MQMNFTKFNSSYVPTLHIPSIYAISWFYRWNFVISTKHNWWTQSTVGQVSVAFAPVRNTHFTSAQDKHTSSTEITVSTARDSDRYCPYSNRPPTVSDMSCAQNSQSFSQLFVIHFFMNATFNVCVFMYLPH